VGAFKCGASVCLRCEGRPAKPYVRNPSRSLMVKTWRVTAVTAAEQRATVAKAVSADVP
jgi:hypothetical protein